MQKTTIENIAQFTSAQVGCGYLKASFEESDPIDEAISSRMSAKIWLGTLARTLNEHEASGSQFSDHAKKQKAGIHQILLLLEAEVEITPQAITSELPDFDQILQALLESTRGIQRS